MLPMLCCFKAGLACRACQAQADAARATLCCCAQASSRRPQLPRRSQSVAIGGLHRPTLGSEQLRPEEEPFQEIGIMRSLCHPNVVRLIEVIGAARPGPADFCDEALRTGPDAHCSCPYSVSCTVLIDLLWWSAPALSAACACTSAPSRLHAVPTVACMRMLQRRGLVSSP